MCDCIENIAATKSKEYKKNGVDACVQVSIKGEISIAQFVIENRPYEEKKIRLSQHRKCEGITLKFCPICGNKREGYQQAQVWHDASNNKY